MAQSQLQGEAWKPLPLELMYLSTILIPYRYGAITSTSVDALTLVFSDRSESRTSMITKRTLQLCALMTETNPACKAASGSGDYKRIQ